MKVLLLILTAIISYALGNLSGGMLLSNYVFRKHKEKYFGANISFSEFAKDFGPLGGVLLIVFDVLKAVIAVLIGGALMGIVDAKIVGRLFASFCLLLGYAFPVLFLFKGGRGMICAAACAFLVDWRIGLCCCVAYIVVVIFTRYQALGAVVGAVLAPVFMFVFDFTGLESVLALLCAIIIVIKHAENLVRLVGGTEPRLDIVSHRGSRGGEQPGPDDMDDDY